jgi:hypothetical protein
MRNVRVPSVSYTWVVGGVCVTAALCCTGYLYHIIHPSSAIHYMNTVGTCVYKTGDIKGFEGRTLVINAGAENLEVTICTQ